MYSRFSKPLKVAGDARVWQRFSATAPSLDDLIEIRRLHDNKTILRRRGDLPAGFAFKTAEWRAAR